MIKSSLVHSERKKRERNKTRKIRGEPDSIRRLLCPQNTAAVGHHIFTAILHSKENVTKSQDAETTIDLDQNDKRRVQRKPEASRGVKYLVSSTAASHTYSPDHADFVSKSLEFNVNKTNWLRYSILKLDVCDATKLNERYISSDVTRCFSLCAVTQQFSLLVA